jgi:hypothetical protein
VPPLTLCLACLILLDVGCRPPNGDMLVAYVRGNFAYGLGQDSWEVGKVKECGDTNRDVLPDKRWGLLVCGAETLSAWDQIWLRPDIKLYIYESAKVFSVAFHSAGRSIRRSGGRNVWDCKRVSERNIDCE